MFRRKYDLRWQDGRDYGGGIHIKDTQGDAVAQIFNQSDAAG